MNRHLFLAPIFALGALAAGPAGADVKAGVEAWSREDFAAAIRQWQGPAASGDADAQFNLAQAYKWGKGVKQDLRQAELLYGKAAAQGHMRASDEYGLLLFDRGEHAMAFPYVRAAAERGDARAQYLVAVAHFNGDMVPRDWVRAYALMSLARAAGLPQAIAGLQQMDGYIPLAQRQQAVALAQQLASDADATRNRQLTSAELGVPVPPPAAPRITIPTPREAVAAATAVAAGSSPRTAGADYARPAVSSQPATPRTAAPVPRPTPAAAAAAPKPAPAPAAKLPVETGGPWRIQLGAFGVAANADALWAKVRTMPGVAGHARINASAGKVTKLQAGGYSQGAAQAACSRLTAAGLTCVPVRN